MFRENIEEDIQAIITGNMSIMWQYFTVYKSKQNAEIGKSEQYKKINASNAKMVIVNEKKGHSKELKYA